MNAHMPPNLAAEREKDRVLPTTSQPRYGRMTVDGMIAYVPARGPIASMVSNGEILAVLLT